jgi:hypothetical protein
MRSGLARAALAVLVALALGGCSTDGGTSAARAGTSPAGGAAMRGSGLATALRQVPDMPAGIVLYTDWSTQGHRTASSFAGGLVNVDAQMHRDLGIRSTDARWELDVDPVGGSPVEVLGFDSGTDLSRVVATLARLGYRADGPVLTGPAGRASGEHAWMFPLRTVGVDLRRHLLVGGADAAAVRPLMTVPAHPVGRAGPVVPLLARIAARQRRTGTAEIVVGSAACVSLTRLIGRANTSPAQLAAVRRQFPGTFTPPQAEIVAVAGPTDTTAVAALTFPDRRTARANEKARTAASRTLGGIAGDENEVRVAGSAVAGRVLGFDLAATRPQAVVQRAKAGTLGIDLCP